MGGVLKGLALGVLSVFFGILSLILLVGVVTSLNELRLDFQSRGWLHVEGRVLHSIVRSWEESRDTYYEPEVEYEYVVKEHKYTSGKVRFGGFAPALPWESQNTAWDVVSRFGDRSVMQVYFDPSDPGLSVLEPGIGWLRSLLAFGLFALMLVAFSYGSIACGQGCLSSIFGKGTSGVAPQSE